MASASTSPGKTIYSDSYVDYYRMFEDYNLMDLYPKINRKELLSPYVLEELFVKGLVEPFNNSKKTNFLNDAYKETHEATKEKEKKINEIREQIEEENSRYRSANTRDYDSDAYYGYPPDYFKENEESKREHSEKIRTLEQQIEDIERKFKYTQSNLYREIKKETIIEKDWFEDDKRIILMVLLPGTKKYNGKELSNALAMHVKYDPVSTSQYEGEKPHRLFFKVYTDKTYATPTGDIYAIDDFILKRIQNGDVTDLYIMKIKDDSFDFSSIEDKEPDPKPEPKPKGLFGRMKTFFGGRGGSASGSTGRTHRRKQQKKQTHRRKHSKKSQRTRRHK
jgi:hypothetical protein